jgi:hypothetical protein
LGLLALVASLVVGSDMFGARQALFGTAVPASKAEAFSGVDGGEPPSTSETRSRPRWKKVHGFQGAAGTTTTPPIAIGDDAIAWRVRWSCRRGRFVVRTSGSSEPLIDAGCPARKTSELSDKVEGGLEVTAAGPWKLRVEQQVRASTGLGSEP